MKKSPKQSINRRQANSANSAKNDMKKKKPTPKPVGKKDSNSKKWAQLNLDQFINSSDEEGKDQDNLSGGDANEDASDIDDSLSNNGSEFENGDDEGSHLSKEDESDMDDEKDSDQNEEDGDTKSAARKHKKTLEKLKNTDPEFYKFLSDNDKALLEFDTSDSEDDERGGSLHKLPNPEDLAVGSDESDEEDALNTKRKSNVVTLKMVSKWQSELKQEK